VTFSFRDKKTGASRRVRLNAVEFIRRFLDHLLPSGFQKVRHYGFFSPTCSVSIQRIRLLITHKTGRPMLLDLSTAQPAPAGHSTARPSFPPSASPWPTPVKREKGSSGNRTPHPCLFQTPRPNCVCSIHAAA